jgi:lipopolysaccharide/colanic/teichoic acid biosynthesis glycosyltransferase
MDRVLALVVLVALLPLILGTAVAVAVVLGRPVLYTQPRVGRGGRVFRVYKFRTLRHDRRQRPHTPAPGGVDRRRTHKSEDDPRHTPLGRTLRKLSLDELPQLFNVLRGDMSMVGPRPELVHLVEGYQPWQRRRHEVKPGITGLWQVSARGTGEMQELTHIDLQYVDSVSLRTDLRILIATPRAVLVRRGA